MSKLFYDYLIEIPDISSIIRENIENSEEREEYWSLIDEIIHHRVMDCIYDNLPAKNHEEFTEMLKETPHDESLLSYLNSKIKSSIVKIIKAEIQLISDELKQELLG